MQRGSEVACLALLRRAACALPFDLLLRWRAHLRTAGRRRVEPKRRRSLGDPPRKASTRPARRASIDSTVSQVSTVDDATRGRSSKPEDARTPALRRAAARVFDAVVRGRAHAAWRAFARKCRRLDRHAVRRAKARGLARFAFFAERRRAVRALVARARRNALFRGVLRFAHVPAACAPSYLA